MGCHFLQKVRPGPVWVIVRRRSHRIFALDDASTLRAAAIDVAAVVLAGVYPESSRRDEGREA
jgi:hypothetical protein